MGNLRRLLSHRPLFLQRSSLFSRPCLFSNHPITVPVFAGLRPSSSPPMLDSFPQKFQVFLSCINYSSKASLALGTEGSSVEEEQTKLPPAIQPMLMLFSSIIKYSGFMGPLVKCPFLIPSTSSSSSQGGGGGGGKEEKEMEGDIQMSHNIVFPQVLRNTRCVGSSHGWLAFISTYDCHLYLSNLPLTAASSSIPYRRPLPPSSHSCDPCRVPIPLVTIQLPSIASLPHIDFIEFGGDHLWPCGTFVFECRKPPRIIDDEEDDHEDSEDCDEDSYISDDDRYDCYDTFSANPRDLSKNFVHKIILSSPPSLIQEKNPHGQCSGTATLVMAILGGEFRDIAFCELAGADSWTLLNKELDSGGYTDIMYSESHQQLYAIRDCDLQLEAWDLRGDHPVKQKTHTPVPTPNNVGGLLDTCKKKYYLVESQGDILVVRRYVAHHIAGNGRIVPPQQEPRSKLPYGTVNFEVMKLDPELDNWQPVEDLGDRVLFVGPNQSISVSAADLNLRPNSIYFADDCFDLMNRSVFRETFFTDRVHYHKKGAYGGQDFGVFNLEDGRVKGKSWKGQKRFMMSWKGGRRLIKNDWMCVPPPVWAFLNNHPA